MSNSVNVDAGKSRFNKIAEAPYHHPEEAEKNDLPNWEFVYLQDVVIIVRVVVLRVGLVLLRKDSRTAKITSRALSPIGIPRTC